MASEKDEARLNGVYYTPSILADYLLKGLANTASQKILDPAYGNGALLLAAERKMIKQSKASDNFSLFGCDITPVNGLLKHLPEANLLKLDFFDYPTSQKHTAVLTNPPFVRHHIQNSESIKKYRSIFPELSVLSNNADLWAYFLVKAVLHLENGGSIGAILPWAFLQADYSQPLRIWLHKKFGDIEVVSLSDKYFDDADERIVVLWLKNYGTSCKSIKLGLGKNTSSKISYSLLRRKDWVSKKVIHNGNTAIPDLLKLFRSKYRFSSLGDHADIKIGVVTGAVEFFILPKFDAENLGFESKNLVPIIESAKQFPDVLKNGKKNLKYCLHFSENEASKFSNYIQLGIDKEYHLRAHSLLRKPWYYIKTSQIPDAFLPYRVSKTPYILRNLHKVQCTNAIHRLYYKDISDIERAWIEVSALCTIGQLSFEICSKTYGRGILKLEPTAVKQAIVLKRKDKSVLTIHSKIMGLLENSQKHQAVKLATSFINRKLKLSKRLALTIENALRGIQESRFD